MSAAAAQARARRMRGVMSALPGKRGLRWLLLVSASLSAIAVFLLATATANTALFAQGYDTLLVVNGVLVGLLMLVVGWQLWQLRRNLKAGVFGSRLAVRLVLLFALVAGAAGRAGLRGVGAVHRPQHRELVRRARRPRARKRPRRSADSSLDYLLNDTANKATQMAVALSDAPGNLVDGAEPRRRAGERLRGGAVHADRRRARRRRHRRLARDARAAAAGGAAPRAAAAAVQEDRADRATAASCCASSCR